MAKAKTRPKYKGRDRKKLRVAIIGAGGRALMAHYPSLRDIPEAELVAVAELDEQRLHKTCDLYDIKGRYSDYRQMLEREKPDAVYAIMPPHHLFDICATIIEHGCHLIIEKPPAVTTEQIRQLAALARRHKVLTGVAFQRRFAPVIRRGKTLCEKRGTVHTAHASFYKNWVGGSPYYRGALDMLTCDGIHAVDTLRYLCGGEVESVASDSRRLDADHWNVHLALGSFQQRGHRTLAQQFHGRPADVQRRGPLPPASPSSATPKKAASYTPTTRPSPSTSWSPLSWPAAKRTIEPSAPTISTAISWIAC